MGMMFDADHQGPVRVAANAVMNRTLGFSITLWFQRLGVCPAGSRLFYIGGDTSYSIHCTAWLTLLPVGITLPSINVAPTTWRSWAMTVSADNVGRAYIDGVPYGTPTTANVPATDGSLRLSLAGRWWVGQMAEFAYWTRELSAAEVWEIGSIQRRLPSHMMSGLGCYLPLMGPTGATVAGTEWGAKDLSGNGNSVASVNSAPVWADDPLPPQAWTEGLFGGALVAVGGGAVPMIYRAARRRSRTLIPGMVVLP